MCTKSGAFSDIQPRHTFSIMDEGERYIKGKNCIISVHDSSNLVLKKEALFSVKTDVSAMDIEENHQNLKRKFSNFLSYT